MVSLLPDFFVEVPIRTVSGMNAREHWRVRHRRVKAERQAVAWCLPSLRPKVPCVVTLTRLGPTNGLDPMDNLPSSMKATADEISFWLGVNDRKNDVVRYEVKQERAEKWAVRIEIRSL